MRPGGFGEFAGTPGGGRLLLAGGLLLIGGARLTFLLLFAVGVLGLLRHFHGHAARSAAARFSGTGATGRWRSGSAGSWTGGCRRCRR